MEKIILALVMIFAFSSADAADKKQIIVGYVENIKIPKIDLALKAKLDTGATTSSIHAEIIEAPTLEEFRENGGKKKQFVTFSIVNGNKQSKNLKKEIVRYVKIKKKEGGHLSRPVVSMEFCLAGELVKEDVNLSDRDNFNYDVLVGRNMLTKANILIDSSKTFTAKPNCAQADQKESKGKK